MPPPGPRSTPLFLEEYEGRRRELEALRAEEEARRAELDPAGGGLTVGEMEERARGFGGAGVGFFPEREEFLGRERLTALGPEIAGREFAEERLETAREGLARGLTEPTALNNYLATILQQGTPQEQEYARGEIERRRKGTEEQARFERGEEAFRQRRQEFPTAGDISAQEQQLDQQLMDEFMQKHPEHGEALFDFATGKLREEMMAKLRSFERRGIPWRYDPEADDIVAATGAIPETEAEAGRGDVRAREAPGRQQPTGRTPERWERDPYGRLRRTR